MSTAGPVNTLLQPVEYQIEETARGIWRRFRSESGELFEEFRSHASVSGLPLLHLTRGKSPETGKTVVARGVVAIGRKAVGVIAIGQMSFGLLAIGQLAIGIAFGLGQATTGIIAIGQAAIGVQFGLGQLTTGVVAIGQFGFGRYVLAQVGFGSFVWDTRGADPLARQVFGDIFALFW